MDLKLDSSDEADFLYCSVFVLVLRNLGDLWCGITIVPADSVPETRDEHIDCVVKEADCLSVGARLLLYVSYEKQRSIWCVPTPFDQFLQVVFFTYCNYNVHLNLSDKSRPSYQRENPFLSLISIYCLYSVRRILPIILQWFTWLNSV